MANHTTPQTTAFREASFQPTIVPPLQNGDHLTRSEFERRYHSMVDPKKWELVEGVVYMPSPVLLAQHSKPHGYLHHWVMTYELGTPGVSSGIGPSIRLDKKNMPEPDVSLMRLSGCGGQTKISEDGYIEGAPEWLAEISASTVSIDLNDKLEAYRRNGVKEYLVWRVQDQAIDWFILRGGQYDRLVPGADGIIKSEVFPGLWLDTAALLQGNLQRVIEVVQLGLASAEHQEFVQQLKQASTPS